MRQALSVVLLTAGVCAGCSNELTRERALELLRSDTKITAGKSASVVLQPVFCVFGVDPDSPYNDAAYLLSLKGKVTFTLTKPDPYLLHQLIWTGYESVKGELPERCALAYRDYLKAGGGFTVGKRQFHLTTVGITDEGTKLGLKFGELFSGVAADLEIIDVGGIRAVDATTREVEFESRYVFTKWGLETGLTHNIPMEPFQRVAILRLYDDGWRIVSVEAKE